MKISISFWSSIFLLPVWLPALSGAPTAAPDMWSRPRSALSDYRDGDHAGALRSIMEYVASDPEDRERKRSAVRLLLEMATESHSSGRDAEALELLKGARTLEDNKEVKELYRTIQQELSRSPETLPAGPAAAVLTAGAAGGSPSINDWFNALEGPGPASAPSGPAEAGAGGARPAAVSRPVRPAPDASSQPVRKRPAPPSVVKGAVDPAPARPVVKPVPAGIPSASIRSFPSVAAMALSVFALAAGAAALNMKRLHERFLRDSELKMRNAYQDLLDEKARIREEQERGMRELGDRLASVMDKVRDMERQGGVWTPMAAPPVEDLEAAEHARYRPAAEPEERHGRTVERAAPALKEDTSASGSPGEPEAAETMLSVDARESAREAAYKSLATRLMAYERFAEQLRGIYEMSKESAVAFADSLSGDPDPHVRAYLAGGLARMPTPESAGILLDLWKDADEDVRRESLRGLMNFYDRGGFSEVFPEELRLRIREVVEGEKHGGEWVF